MYTVTVFDETLHNLEDHGTVCSRVHSHNSDYSTLSYIFFNVRPKIKKMCVSGYPTVPNCLP